MKRITIIHLVILFPLFLSAQLGKEWHSSFENHELKGNIKYWIMKGENGIIREREYNINGDLIKDTILTQKSYPLEVSILSSKITTVDSYTNPEVLFPTIMLIPIDNSIKEYYENKHTKYDSSLLNKGCKIKYNAKRQIIKISLRKRDNICYITNKFNPKGKLISSKTHQKFVSKKYWDYSQDKKEPFYLSTEKSKSIAYFEYNNKGKELEFQYLHSDIFKNFRFLYTYDSVGNLIEQLDYHSYNIDVLSHKENYISSFSSKKAPPEFWDKKSPSKATWKYDKNNNKIEYTNYDFSSNPTYIVTWNYNTKGELTEETQYNFINENKTVHSNILFDNKGNVTQEVIHDYWSKKNYNFNYVIQYY